MEKKEFLLGSGAGLAALYPEGVINVLNWGKDAVQSVVDATTSVVPQAGAAAPFAIPAAAGLTTGRFTQWSMDKVGIKNKLLRYPAIAGAAYLGASSTVAPYLAGGAALYYGTKFGLKYSAKALKGLGNMAGRGARALNPFSGTGGATPQPATT